MLLPGGKDLGSGGEVPGLRRGGGGEGELKILVASASPSPRDTHAPRGGEAAAASRTMNPPPAAGRIAPAPWMTVKLGESSGEEGVKKLGKRAGGDEESLEEEGAGGGGGEAAPGSSSTKKEEKIINNNTNSSPPPNPSLSQAPASIQPSHSQDQHHFLRSSVRPQSKRLKKDSQASSSVGSSTAAKGKAADNGGTASGGTSGIPASNPAGNSKSAARNLGSSSGEKEEGKKVRRQWESWSTEDKNTFFEGLYEHGKDFEAIQNNIALKYKKKGKPASMVKNKEQVRHFYYRTWHKISKYIDFDNVFSQGLKKSSLELYGLICYGELRKKIGGCMDDKNAAKLNELIQAGATTVRYKGRNLRIKAPMCRALKKLCDPDGVSDEEDQKPVRLPLKVPVELQPRNNHAWARVQSLAQNPRLRMIVELHRKVSSLIEFLKQKWALHEVREEGWSLRTSESLTLAEVYLMMGKPNKLQLEYDWLAVLEPETQDAREQTSESSAVPACPTFHKQRLLNCLLKLISTEVNPKSTPEMNSVATSPIKPAQEEQSLTPPGKVIAVSTRSPGCARNQSTLRNNKTFSPGAAPSSSGLRNLPRPLLVAGPSSSGSTDADGGLFAVPTTLPPNSRHGKLFLPSKEAELTFRQHLDTISMQSDFFLPKPRKLRNRHLRKPLVVQRTLLPRPSGNPSQHVCSFSILSNSSITGRGSFRPIQSSLTKAAVSRPIVPKVLPTQATNHLSSAIDLAAKSAGIIPGSPVPVLDADGLSGVSPLSPEGVTTVLTGQESTVAHQNGGSITTVEGSGPGCRVPFISLPARPEQEAVPDDFQGTSVLSLSELSKTPLPNSLSTPPVPSSEASSTRLSPPNVSALLDISLPGPPEDVLSQGEPATQISDSIIEIAISSGQYSEGVSLSPAKLNGSDSSKSLPSPSSSPQQSWIASPSHDPQWYPNDSTDSSLSSLFSSFISPEKGRKMLPTPVGTASGTSLLGPSLLDGNSRDSFVSRSLADVAEVVDSQLACMMNENSIDYISRFNDLAQELSIPEPTRREILFDGGGGGPPIGDLSQ
ncbi:protein cramped-like isoform 5-T6 [Chlamydotis macqueenii]